VDGSYTYQVTTVGEFSANAPQKVIQNKVSIITLDDAARAGTGSM